MSAFAFLNSLLGAITGYRLFNYAWVVQEITELATLLGFIIGGRLMWRSHRLLHVRKRGRGLGCVQRL